ncbi:MAG: DUF1566 domain-containing protein [Proteobacteria bacterium]|nr:DUF1566 domain-containing protein [Pseudomonadota bacterium]
MVVGLAALILIVHSSGVAMADYRTRSAKKSVKSKTVIDDATDLEWQVNEAGKKTWNLAVRYCRNLNTGGKTDWRLPTIEELLTLIEYLKSHPAIGKNVFENVRSAYYWSSSTRTHSADRAWLVFFNSSDVKYLYKSSNAYVRCVRGGQ